MQHFVPPQKVKINHKCRFGPEKKPYFIVDTFRPNPEIISTQPLPPNTANLVPPQPTQEVTQRPQLWPLRHTFGASQQEQNEDFEPWDGPDTHATRDISFPVEPMSAATDKFQRILLPIKLTPSSSTTYIIVLFSPIQFSDGLSFLSFCSSCCRTSGDMQLFYNISSERSCASCPRPFSCEHIIMALSFILHRLNVPSEQVSLSALTPTLQHYLCTTNKASGWFALQKEISPLFTIFVHISTDLSPLLFKYTHVKKAFSCLNCTSNIYTCGHIKSVDFSFLDKGCVLKQNSDNAEEDLQRHYLLSTSTRHSTIFMVFFWHAKLLFSNKFICLSLVSRI